MDIYKYYNTPILALNRANTSRLRLNGGRLLTQPPGHCNVAMP
ncbi:hypothetical protein DWUX_1355 [Desulfovibrio diazotrophicus]|nr:hypothetical protein DWUX_1355 [Desulfovibrio diazotrophicus]